MQTPTTRIQTPLLETSNTCKAALLSGTETLVEETEPPKELLLISKEAFQMTWEIQHTEMRTMGLSRLESCFLTTRPCTRLQWFASLDCRSTCSSGQRFCQLSKHYYKNTLGLTTANLQFSTPVSCK